MPKAYIILQCTVHDPELMSEYRALSEELLARNGGRFLVRGGKIELREGDAPPERNVVIEFDSMEQLKRFYDSEEYQGVLKMRQQASEGRLFFIEGYEEPK